MPTNCEIGITEAIAQAYFDAARAGANMRAAADSFETIRESVSRGDDVFASWAVIDEQIGLADLQVLAPLLVRVRQEFKRCVIAAAVERLDRAFEEDRSKGWRTWLESYLASFSEWGWYTSYGAAIAKQALRHSPVEAWPIERIRHSAALVENLRWPETYDWFLFLSGTEAPPDIRARMLVIAAEIQLYHFAQPGKARGLLEQARELAPDSPRVWAGWGEYLLDRGKAEEAKPYFERVILARPEDSDGFTGLGDYYDAAGDQFAAESQYQQAIQNAPGTSDGYRRLIKWHGRTNWFKDRENLLGPLFERLKLVDSPAAACTELAVVYKQNLLPARAREYFQQAFRDDEQDFMARTWVGYTYIDEAVADDVEEAAAAELYKKAQVIFEILVELAPKALDGYWGMTSLLMQRKDWAAALEWCDRALGCHPEWESYIRARRGDVLRELGRLPEARSDVLRALELEPESATGLDALSNLAEAFENTTTADEALELLERLRQFKGPSFEDTYQNRVGNLKYGADDYAGAAEHYRLAVAAKETDAVLHSNLALALEHLRVPGARIAALDEAISALRRALELDPKNDGYRSRLSSDDLERAFVLAYGEDALDLDPMITPVRVEVNEDLLPDILDSRTQNLSDDVLSKIEAMRSGVAAAFGVKVPGVRFMTLGQAEASPGRYRILIMMREIESGQAQPGAVSDSILQHLRRVLEQKLADFVGHQEVTAMLDTCPEESRSLILSEKGELTRLVRALKSMCRQHVPLLPFDRLVAEYLRLRHSGLTAVEASAKLPAALAGAAAGASGASR